MRLNLKIAFICLIISALCSDVYAQGQRQREYSGFFDSYYYRGPINYTLGFGITSYRGDLAKSIGLNNLGYSVSIGANYKVWPMIVLGGEFTYFTLSGSDFDSRRAISFTSTNMELLAYGRFYFFDEVVRISPDRKKEKDLTFFKPYLSTGIGFLMFSPSSTYADSIPAVAQSLEGKRYPGYGPVVPVGLGFSLHPSHRLSFAIEVSYRFTFTDYLDDVSRRGNSGTKDGYAFAGIKVQFAPSAPKKKKTKVLPPPAQYNGPKGTETWKTRPKEEPKKRNNYYYEEEPAQEEGEENQGEENNDWGGDQPQNNEEQNDDGGWGN